LLVELTWPSGKLSREYTFLLDPPGYVPEQPAQAEVQAVAPEVQAAAPAAPEAAVSAVPAVPEETRTPSWGESRSGSRSHASGASRCIGSASRTGGNRCQA